MDERSIREELPRNPTNYVPLSPVDFLRRSAVAFPDKTAVVDGDRRYGYREFHRRCRRLASALSRRGIKGGDTVAILAPNVPAMLEAHYGVPMCGGVLNALNTRLDAATIGFCLRHGEARLVLVDMEFLPLMREALAVTGLSLPLVAIASEGYPLEGEEEYEELLETGDAADDLPELSDEWSPISLGYTSGTTGDPKGVLCHHRGAYLNALGNVLAARLDPESVYLWTLPMFHCNGWSHTWAVTAAGGTHVCLRRIDAARILRLIEDEGVSHMSAAPVVLGMLADKASANFRFSNPVRILTGGSAPPRSLLSAMERMGVVVMHIFGQTETTGPSLICEWQRDWDELPSEERHTKRTRQGVPLTTMHDAIVANPQTGREVAADGQEMGEILLRGSTVMMGYLRNPSATAQALAGGWFHTGDLAVRHPDGHIEIRDRAKDIIISGGENISSVEIEDVLHSHPAVAGVAVVAQPHPKWGETPCAFVELRSGSQPVSGDELAEFCRARLAGFKMPRSFVFCTLPRTATGKVQKFELRKQAEALAASPEPAGD